MDTKNDKGRLIKILSRSYIFYFLLFFGGILLDLKFPTHYLNSSYALSLGLILIIIATGLIIWIKTNAKNAKKETITKEDFMQGPYKYSSIPNHWAVFFLILGFGVLINAAFAVVITILAFALTLPKFLKMQETVLVEKYGNPYQEYRKIVKF